MYRQFIGRRVLLIMESGTIDGTLAAVAKDGLIMTRATFIAEQAQPQPFDGVVLVPHSTVQFAQVL